MSTWISYQDKGLGRIKPNEHYKLEFIAESLEDLETLFSLPPDAILEIEGSQDITYKEFKEQMLPKISVFYPTYDQWVLKHDKANSIEEYVRSNKKP